MHLSGEPVLLLGPTGRVLYVNPAWEELTGCAAAEVLNREAGQAGGDATAELLDGFRPPAEVLGGAACSALGLIRHRDGRRFWRRVEFWPHRDREGKPLFVLGVVRAAEEAAIAPESPASRLRAELWRAREQLVDRLGTDVLIGLGPAHRRLVDQVEAAASVAVPVLIVGPPGSGKRQVARAIHRRSGRTEAQLMLVDCAALPAELLDRELFKPSSDRGAAPASFRLGDGATLLLGDVLELPRDVQARLVAAWEGSEGPRPRLLAMTADDPERAVREDRLRPDLYYTLSTLVIRLAPLRERLEELPILAQHFLDRANRRDGTGRIGFRPEAIDVLLRYDWPGNLRELARVVESAHGRAESDLIGPEDLPATIRGHLGAAYLPPAPPEVHAPLDEMLERLERRLIERALRSSRGNKSMAAKQLHISRARLHRRILELGLAGESVAEGDDGPPPSGGAAD